VVESDFQEATWLHDLRWSLWLVTRKTANVWVAGVIPFLLSEIVRYSSRGIHAVDRRRVSRKEIWVYADVESHCHSTGGREQDKVDSKSNQ
jgi:hypothetical protein